MKLSCKVIEDILPMYYDSVCSDESAALVEQHLKECPSCGRVLSQLHSGMEQKPLDDMKPLAGIQRTWKKRKWKYFGRGICITLAVVLLIAAVLSGSWYINYGKYWYQLVDVMDRPTKEDRFVTASDYALEKNGYRFDICLPMILSNSGFVRVMNDDLVLFFYPETGGDYSFWLYITDQYNESYSVYLKSDMKPDFDNHPFPVRSEGEKQKITRLLAERKEDVNSILDAVQALWGIDLLKYAP